MPTILPSSVTAKWRMPRSAIKSLASCAERSISMVMSGACITCDTRIWLASPPTANTLRTRSDSLTTPTNCEASATNRAPTCASRIVRAASMTGAEGEIPIYEPGLAELVRKGLSEGRLTFTTDLGRAVETGLAIFIAVGTPSREDGSADLSFVEEVGRGIAAHLNGYKVIVTKSTVPVGTGQRVRELIEQHGPRPVHFDIVSNPEFLREGSAIEDFMRPNRVVIGADSPQAEAIMRDLYRPLYLIEPPFVFTDIATAEMIKYTSNAFLAT